ncbi:MAG: dihydrodipicolinate synthase family protein [Haloferacaceae archaeon]
MVDRGEIYPALVTPFDDEGEVDHAALADLVRALSDDVDGMVPCGTTGEFASMTPAERRRVVETTASATDLPVVAGAADTSVRGVRERVAAAADAGADAALVPLPYYHGANDPEGHETFLTRVADAADLPLVLYNIPGPVGRTLDADLAATMAAHGNVTGLKDSSGDLDHLLTVAERTPDGFDLYQGYDSLLVPGLAFGATGGINALANVVPGALADLADAVAAGDFDRAMAVHREAVAPVFRLAVEHGFAPTTKVAAAARGLLPDAAVRPPLVELDGDARTAVEEAARAAAAVV